MPRTYHTESAAATRSMLNEHGIKEPMWKDFQWTCKFGPHIRRDSTGTFELKIEAEGNGYCWSFYRV